jgi:hypothetical protein
LHHTGPPLGLSRDLMIRGLADKLQPEADLHQESNRVNCAILTAMSTIRFSNRPNDSAVIVMHHGLDRAQPATMVSTEPGDLRERE